jgi:hypothetical protein
MEENVKKLREFGIISDISLISFYTDLLDIKDFIESDSNAKNKKNNLNQTMKTIILEICNKELRIDEGVNLKKEMDELEKNEPMMYYGIKRYRDHLMHSARIALLGKWLMEKRFNYFLELDKKHKCSDCLENDKCPDLSDDKSLEISIDKMTPDLIVTAITDQEKTSIPFNKPKNLYDYDRAFCYHLKKPGEDNLLKKIWFITAIDHDIGYSFTYLRELFKSNSMLKSDSPDELNNPKLDKAHTISTIKRELENVFDHLYDLIRTHATSIDAILHDTCLKVIPHGVIGAFHVRNLIENEYVLEMAARAIARHDDDSRQICFHKEPLCFLLVLLDEIQEWGRPLKIAEEFGFDEIQSFSMKLFARCDLPYIKYYRVHKDNKDENDELGTFVFELDYTITEDIFLKQTKFSFPHFFYLKQLNLSRLVNGPRIKVRVRMPDLAKEQFQHFKNEMENKYKIAAEWADEYINVENDIVEFDMFKSTDPKNYFDMRPPKIWPLIKSIDFFEDSKKGKK